MFEAVQQRRTCRQYNNSKKISREDLEKIVEAGRRAPTGCNYQSLDFFVVDKQEILDQVAEAVYSNLPQGFKDFMGNPGPVCIFYGAPAAVFLVASRPLREDCAEYDMGIVTDSMLLAAHSLGIQSTTVGCARMGNGKAIQQLLGLPDDKAPMAVALGYAAPEWQPGNKEIASKIHWVE